MYKVLTNIYLSMFCAEMAVIFETGISLSDGVLMLLDDADKDGKVVLQSLLDEIEKGSPFSSALRGSGYFTGYMSGMVETGEKTGRLSETMKALSEYYDGQERLGAAVKNAVFYPAILLVIMVAVVLVLIIQVLPIFNDVFGRLGSRMSPLGLRLIQFGGWLGSISVIIAAVFGALFLIAVILWLSPKIRGGVSKAVKYRWGSRGISGAAASSHFVSAMALSMASGLNAGEAVEMAAGVSGGARAVDEKNVRCLELLRSGSTLSEAMLGAGILSSRESRMLALGERGGMADSAMAEIARRKERGTQDKIDRVIGRIEPTLVIITSVVVGIILLSVMLPLMGIMTTIG